jgi:hypothetical protein
MCFTGDQADENARLHRELEIAKLENELGQIQIRSLLRSELIGENFDCIRKLEHDLEEENELKEYQWKCNAYESFEGHEAIVPENLAEWWRGVIFNTLPEHRTQAINEWLSKPENMSLEPVRGTAIADLTDDGKSNDSEYEGSISPYHGPVRLCYLISIVLAPIIESNG